MLWYKKWSSVERTVMEFLFYMQWSKNLSMGMAFKHWLMKWENGLYVIQGTVFKEKKQQVQGWWGAVSGFQEQQRDSYWCSRSRVEKTGRKCDLSGGKKFIQGFIGHARISRFSWSSNGRRRKLLSNVEKWSYVYFTIIYKPHEWDCFLRRETVRARWMGKGSKADN